MSSMSSKTDDIERLLPLEGIMPEGDERAAFNNVSVRQPADPSFDCSLLLPDGWYRQDTPPSDWAVSDEGFATLGVFSPRERMVPPVVVSCGVTRMPEGASVKACYEQYCRHMGYEILAARPQEVLAGAVIDGVVRQPAPALDFTMRLIMFEDGGHLYGLSGMAPSLIYPDVVRELSLALCTFELEWPFGPTAPLTDDDA